MSGTSEQARVHHQKIRAWELEVSMERSLEYNYDVHRVADRPCSHNNITWEPDVFYCRHHRLPSAEETSWEICHDFGLILLFMF